MKTSRKFEMATLLACALFVGCSTSHNTADNVVDFHVPMDSTSDCLVVDSTIANNVDSIVTEKYIITPQSIINSINSIDDKEKKELSDSLDFRNENLSEINYYLDRFVSLIENDSIKKNSDSDNKFSISKVVNGNKIYYFTFCRECYGENILYGYLIYVKQEDFYKLLDSNPIVIISPKGINNYDVNIVNLKDERVLIEISRGGGDETVCGHMGMGYYSIDGDCLFWGTTFDGCDGFDEEDEEGDKRFSNGYSNKNQYTLDSINYTDGYPVIINEYEYNEWYGNSDSIVSSSEGTEYYMYSKKANKYILE